MQPWRRYLIAGLALAALAAPASASASGGRLTISPQPSTPDASPATQISILGVARNQIRSVSVAGQASGAHGGHLSAYSGHRGASFLLDQPLTQGESVSVEILIKGRKPIDYSFTVAKLGPSLSPLNLTSIQPDKLDHFVTEPDLTPPRITINRSSKRARGHGSVLLTPLPSPVVHPQSNNAVTINPVGPGGPMIVDGGGNLVWFRQLARPE